MSLRNKSTTDGYGPTVSDAGIKQSATVAVTAATTIAAAADATVLGLIGDSLAQPTANTALVAPRIASAWRRPICRRHVFMSSYLRAFVSSWLRAGVFVPSRCISFLQS